MRRSDGKGSLQVGDRLQKVGMPGLTWIVEELLTPKNERPHAVIVFESDPGEKRMIALSILCDKNWYLQLPTPSREAGLVVPGPNDT